VEGLAGGASSCAACVLARSKVCAVLGAAVVAPGVGAAVVASGVGAAVVASGVGAAVVASGVGAAVVASGVGAAVVASGVGAAVVVVVTGKDGGAGCAGGVASAGGAGAAVGAGVGGSRSAPHSLEPVTLILEDPVALPYAVTVVSPRKSGSPCKMTDEVVVVAVHVDMPSVPQPDEPPRLAEFFGRRRRRFWDVADERKRETKEKTDDCKERCL
jgi:hypothetical protein